MADDLSSSLVREYLSRKGLKKTLGQLDLELPRTENSISKRNALARSLHIESIIKKCKATPTSHSLSMLECLVQYILENPIDTQNVSHTPNYIEPIPKDGKPITSRIEPHPPSTEPRPPATDSRPPATDSRPSNSKIKPRVSGGVTSTGLLSMSKSRGRVKIRNVSKGLINDDKRTVIDNNHPILHEISHDIKPHDSSLITGNTATSTIVCEDVEDCSVDITLPTQLAIDNTTHINTSSPISLNIAKSLRELVFGTATGPSFNDEWRLQGITMVQSIPELSYGIVQHKGGPCGILACVQAYILKYVLFGENTTAKKLDSVPLLSVRQQQIAVIEAICEILWKVHTNAVIVTLKGSTHNVVTSIGSRGYSPDGLTEQLQISQFTQYELLKDCITKNIHQFTSTDGRHSDGVILLLYSIVLSHDIAQIKEEMDSPCNILLGSHGYCSQELINLILTANASSNVFNGQSIIDEDNAPPTILRGVTSPCEIGYLTLFEYYKSCQVGSHYKNPSLPIWVVCAESHYTVLFSCNIDCIKDNTTRQLFSLHYYDGLAHFTEPIILEISFDDIPSLMNTIDDLTPPLELVIRTRWPDLTSVKWNCDPLL